MSEEQVVSVFRLKQVSFFQRQVMILCQNKNGPCPLIAITNILLLKGRLVISTDLSYISIDEIVQMVAEVIFEENERLRQSHSTDVIQQTFDDILTILPKLAKGLDLNVCFHGVNKFEFTQEISIFDTLQIPLLHGWLYDTNIDELVSVVGDKSYNHLVYKLVDYKTLIDRLTTQSQESQTSVEELVQTLDLSEQELYQHGMIIDQFLNESAAQLTEVGLIKLYEFMQDRQLAVFFRNNHFSTIFSYNGQLFLLVTDLGYYDQDAVVWELLMNVNGSSDFYTSQFEPVSEFMIKEQGLETPPPTGSHSMGGGTIAIPPTVVSTTQPSTSFPMVSETESPLHNSTSNISQVNNAPTITAQKMTGNTGVDPDLMLAMQLQMEEENAKEEDSRQRPQQGSSSHPASTRDSQAPAPLYTQTTSRPPATANNIPGDAEGLGLSQEEMDQQLAMMLHYQEMKQNQTHPPANNRPPTNHSQSHPQMTTQPQPQARTPRSQHSEPNAAQQQSRSQSNKNNQTSSSCILQ